MRWVSITATMDMNLSELEDQEHGMLQSLELERVGHSNSTKCLLDGAVSGWQASLVACNAGDLGLPWFDPLEEEMATHSSTLPWKMPWTKKPGRLHSGSQGVGARLSNFQLSRTVRKSAGFSYQKVSIGGALTSRSRKEHAAKEDTFLFYQAANLKSLKVIR